MIRRITSRPATRRGIECWLCLLLALAVSPVATGQVTISHTSPGAAAPGKAVDVTIVGQKLDDPLSVWTSFPAQVQVLPPAEAKPGQTQRVVRLTLDANVPVGVGGLIVATAEGASDLHYWMVDDLPSIADNGQNQTFAQAQDVALPAAVDAVSDGSRFDHYRFQVVAGQRVAVEVVAGRMGRDFDPVLRLLDAAGKELLVADDDGSLGSDCRFAHTFQTAGQYVVEVRDNQFRGGGRYRLRMGDFPLITSAYPLGGQQGTAAKLSFFGPQNENVPPLDVALPPNAVGGRLAVSAKLPGGASSGMATIAVTNLPEAAEIEPNNDAATATRFTVPGAVSGRLETAGDRDSFQFDAKKGQRLVFKAGTRSFGSPVMLKMYVQKADGAQLAESAVSDSDEESLVFAIPEDGSYRLAVEDLLKRGGFDFAYRVAVEPAASFVLSLKPDKATRHKFVVPKNGAMAIDFQCARTGYDGPVTMSVEGPGGVYQVINPVLAEKQAAGKLLVVPPAELTVGQFAAIRVIGRATIDGSEVVATTSTIDLMRALRPQLSYPPAWFDGVVSVAAAADGAPLFTTAADRASVLVPRQSGQGDFTVALERKNAEFKDPLLIHVLGAPAGFAYEIKRNGNGPMEQYQVIARGPKDLPEGQHMLRIVSYGELKGLGQLVTTNVPLHVVTPLTVTVAPAGGLVFGNQQKVRLTVARLATGSDADKQPVMLKWKKLPPGVTGPESVMIPPDQTTVDVDLVAAADAAPGRIEDLAVIATTKFQGQDVTVESAPIAAEVKK